MSQPRRQDEDLLESPPAPWTGASIPADLDAIATALRQKRFDTVHAETTSLLDRPDSSFSSPKMARFIKARAHYFRGQACAGQDRLVESCQHFERAAALGDPAAPFEAAARLLLLADREANPKIGATLREKALSFFEDGAEFGSTPCMSVLRQACIQENRKDDANYWFLLERMSDPESRRSFARLYSEYMDSDRAFLTGVMERRSLAGGARDSDIPGLPGRSTLTAALVDLLMRRQMAFVWRAFYSDKTSPADTKLLDVYSDHRRVVSDNPFATMYLLTVGGSRPDENILGVSREQLKRSLLPGDGLVLRSGSMVHYATAWAIARDRDRVLLLDPFHEFWQPSHNSAISDLEFEPCKHERQLLSLRWTEVGAILDAVIAIRDRVTPARR